MEKPPQVNEARRKGDRKALSEMGRAGARKKKLIAAETAKELALRAEEDAVRLAIADSDAKLASAEMGQLSEDGDVLPPDPAAIAALKAARQTRGEN